jgi:hypothetical protein
MEETRAAPPKLSRDEEITRLVRAYIGPRWESHYARAWRRLGSAAGVNIGWTWNWAAALLTIPWLAYRKQASFAAGLIVVYIVLLAYTGEPMNSLVGTRFFAPVAVWLVLAIPMGIFGDVMVLQRAYSVASAAHNEAGANQAVASGVIKSGGVSAGNVVRIIVLPAAVIAFAYFFVLVPYARRPYEQDEAAMRSYLDQLQSIEEQYHIDSGRYIADPDAFRFIADSVERTFVPEIVATDSSYHAIVRSTPPLNVECAIANRMLNPVSGDSASGVVCHYDQRSALKSARERP